MNTGDNDSTGCEEGACESDECVKNITELSQAALLSNQIHIANPEFKRKPWKSWPEAEFSL